MVADKDTRDGANGATPRQPGEPVPADAIDPELISLPRAKPRVGPVLAASVVTLSVFLLARIWPDFRFSREDKAQRFDQLSELMAADADSYVTATAMVDLTVGAVVRRGKGEYGHRIRPALGTGGKLWVMTHSLHWHSAPAYDNTVTGRLAILGDLPFFDQLEGWWNKSPAPRRVVDAAALRGALEQSAGEVAVVGGDRVALGPDTEVELFETVPTKVALTTYYTEDRPDERAWTLTLTNIGLHIVGGRSQGQGESGETFLYEVEHPGGVDAVRALLDDKRIFAARAEPVVRRHSARLEALRAGADGLSIGGERALPWGSIDLLSIVSRYPLDPEARVIVVTDRPEDYWHVAPLIALLSISALFFAFILVRPVLSELLRKRAA